MDAETFKDFRWHEWHIGVLAQIAVRGALQSSGQNCSGAERFYIHKGIYASFVAEVVKIVKSITMVPEQLDEFRCGYYVMKYMKEMIVSYALETINAIQSLIIFKFNDRSYCIMDIDDVCMEWTNTVKVPVWIDGKEVAEYVGVSARFGKSLVSNEKRANQTRVSLADPPNCCSKPRNKLSGEVILVHRGNCSFVTKGNVAEDAVASALLII